MSVMRTQAIQNFLKAKTHPDLALLYNEGMEVQVNVAKDNGEKEKGEYKGKEYVVWTDGQERWKSFRIPYKAMSEPEYTDVPMSFSLDKHAEGIGMTGWDWKAKVSRWVAYDFDTIIGHSDKHNKKLSDDELSKIIKIVENIPWVTLRKSTGGRGLHLYVFVNVPTSNHTEHAALARSILNMLSALTGYEFSTKVDTCGGNMWVWHRKLKDDGLVLLKQGVALEDIPHNWKTHVPVVSNRSPRVHLQEISQPDEFEQLSGQRTKLPLDEKHKELIKWLQDHKAFWWWDNDLWMLVTHTTHLRDAHVELKMVGRFDTLAKGEEHGHDHNCYAFPLRNGSWVVRRYTQRTEEAKTWQVDSKGWTRCFLNRKPDFGMVCLSNEAVEHPGGGYHFKNLTLLKGAMRDLGLEAVMPFDPISEDRKCTVALQKKDNTKLVISIESFYREQNRLAKASSQPMAVEPQNSTTGWILEKKNNWVKVFTIESSEEPEKAENYDDIIRHVVSESNEDRGWLVKSNGGWRDEPLTHAKAALVAHGYTPKEINDIVGTQVLQAWTLVNKPFQPEYPGNRQWNRHAAQFAFTPNPYLDDAGFPTWRSVLQHCGSGLDEVVKEDLWCQRNNILTGGDYLLLWVASLFKEPYAPLPYLFFYGEQGTGKSTFHIALSLLLTKGYMRADTALGNTSFNGELLNAVLCVVEETDLRNSKLAYNRIKDWVTSPDITIHVKGMTPYLTKNSTHWIQVANEIQNCPVFPGDTRITMIEVPALEKNIPPSEFRAKLIAEAPDFLGYILKLEIPSSGDRLNVPVLLTQDKIYMEETNKNPVLTFIEEECFYVEGAAITFAEFYEKFLEEVSKVDPLSRQRWTKHTVARSIPAKFPRGKLSNNVQAHIGNMSFEEKESIGPKYYREQSSQVLKQ